MHHVQTLSLRAAAAAPVLTLAGVALPATAQNRYPADATSVEQAREFGSSTAQSIERGAERAWDATKDTGERPADATKRGTRKAANATERGAERAWDSTKNTTKRAANATERGARKAGNATADVAHDAADGMRSAGNKVGEKIPGTGQHDAASKN